MAGTVRAEVEERRRRCRFGRVAPRAQKSRGIEDAGCVFGSGGEFGISWAGVGVLGAAIRVSGEELY